MSTGNRYWEPEDGKFPLGEMPGQKRPKAEDAPRTENGFGKPAITPPGMEIGVPVGAATEQRLRENAVMEKHGALPPVVERVTPGIYPGAVVQLKSGGPLMTVGKIITEDDGTSAATCFWWDAKANTSNRWDFPVDALRVAKDGVVPVMEALSPSELARREGVDPANVRQTLSTLVGTRFWVCHSRARTVTLPTESQKGLLSRVLAHVPDHITGEVQVVLPENPGEDAFVCAPGFKKRFRGGEVPDPR